MMEWNVDDRLPRYESRFPIEVWSGRNVRHARRIGFRESDESTLSPGTLVYTDCTHPMQNMLCDESKIIGWRYLAAGACARSSVLRPLSELDLNILPITPLSHPN